MTAPTRDFHVLERALDPDAVARLFSDVAATPDDLAPDDLAAAAWRVEHSWAAALLGGGLSGEAWYCWKRALDDAAIFAWLTSEPGRIPPAALRATLAGVGRAEPEGETWLPVPPGERRGWPAVLLPVWAGIPADCFDLLALDPADASRWAARTGNVPVLSSDGLAGFEISPWREAGPPGAAGRIRLYRYPLDWLRAQPEAHACCVLDWASGVARDLLRLVDDGCIAPVCCDDAHAAEIRAMARPKRPKLIVEVVCESKMESG